MVVRIVNFMNILSYVGFFLTRKIKINVLIQYMQKITIKVYNNLIFFTHYVVFS